MNNPAQPYRILVVDDVPANLKLVSEILSGYGYRVRPASSGSMALRTVEVEAPDLILLDVRMPEMDGYEATAQIRQFNTDAVIIAQTAYALSGDFVKAIAAGCNDYITKPVQKEHLIATVQKYFDLNDFKPF